GESGHKPEVNADKLRKLKGRTDYMVEVRLFTVSKETYPTDASSRFTCTLTVGAGADAGFESAPLNRRSRSNQNGAPCATATIVAANPMILRTRFVNQSGLLPGTRFHTLRKLLRGSGRPASWLVARSSCVIGVYSQPIGSCKSISF